MTDVLIYQTNDQGDIDYLEGRATLDETGLSSAAFLSLFGGNEDDSGLEEGDPKQWWGNLTETDPERQYRSQFQNLLLGLPAIPANLRRLEDTAAADLAWMTNALVESVNAEASIPALNRVKVTLSFVVNNDFFKAAFEAPWGNAS